MNLLSFLFDRKKSCAECVVRSEHIGMLSAHNESVMMEVQRERIGRLAWRDVARRRQDGLTREQAEREGLIRELWMERRRIDEMKADFDARYRQLSARADLLQTMLQHSRAEVREKEMAIRDLEISIRDFEQKEAKGAKEVVQ